MRRLFSLSFYDLLEGYVTARLRRKTRARKIRARGAGRKRKSK